MNIRGSVCWKIDRDKQEKGNRRRRVEIGVIRKIIIRKVIGLRIDSIRVKLINFDIDGK
jgi:hypothetical protein